MTTCQKILLCGVMGILLSGMLGCRSHESPDEPEREEEKMVGSHVRAVALEPEVLQSMGISFTEIHSRVLHEWVEAVGRFAMDPAEVVSVRPKSEGTIVEVRSDVGEVVVRGAVLARIRAREGKAIYELLSPISGMVMGRFVSDGNRVDAFTTIFSMADLTTLRLSIDIYEKDIGRIRTGQPCEVRVPAFPEKVFHGRLAYISPRVDEDTRTIKVRVDVKNPGGELRLGMMAGVRVAVDTRKALAVPSSSIQKIEGETSVFVTRDGTTFHPRAVSTGMESDGYVEIRSGLETEEKVVFQGAFTLKSELLKESFGEED